jgi:hypothetical protein
VEKPDIQIFKNNIEVVKMSLRATQSLAPSHLTNQMCLANNVVAPDIFAIAGRVGSIDGFAVDLRE